MNLKESVKELNINNNNNNNNPLGLWSFKIIEYSKNIMRISVQERDKSYHPCRIYNLNERCVDLYRHALTIAYTGE